jgi:hypothetical protein
MWSVFRVAVAFRCRGQQKNKKKQKTEQKFRQNQNQILIRDSESMEESITKKANTLVYLLEYHTLHMMLYYVYTIYTRKIYNSQSQSQSLAPMPWVMASWHCNAKAMRQEHCQAS